MVEFYLYIIYLHIIIGVNEFQKKYFNNFDVYMDSEKKFYAALGNKVRFTWRYTYVHMYRYLYMCVYIHVYIHVRICISAYLYRDLNEYEY
jgi:hypothetical protein